MPIRISNSRPKHLCTLAIILCLLFILVLGCTSPTSGNNGTFTGTITLNNDTGNSTNDPADFSGVSVALYNPAKLDTTIVRINNEFPNIGVLISQRTEFDHRLQTPVKTVQTGANGSFKLSKIPVGVYNMVVLKEGWGIRYFYDLHITKGDNTLSELLESTGKPHVSTTAKPTGVELYPATILDGYITNGFTFKSNHTYIVEDNLTFIGNVSIEPTSYIWIAPARSISINEGSLTTPDIGSDYSRITTSYGMYNLTATPITTAEHFYSIDCPASVSFSQNKFNSIITTYAQAAWNIKAANLSISNLVFKYIRIGLQCNQSDALSVTNCNIMNAYDNEYGSISITSGNGINLSKLIIINCKNGIRQHTTSETNISNCYFQSITSISVNNLYETTGNVTHCVFNDAYTAIKTSGQSNTAITYCNIHAKLGIYNTVELNWPTSTFLANYNNLFCTQYGARTTANFYHESHIDAKRNFWGVTDVTLVPILIWDLRDENPNSPEYNVLMGYIDYLPIKTAKEPTAGIVIN